MEKTAVKPPWKSLRDSHFPHSPGDGAFHFTKNTSSAEPAIYPQISLSKHLSRPSGSRIRQGEDVNNVRLDYRYAQQAVSLIIDVFALPNTRSRWSRKM